MKICAIITFADMIEEPCHIRGDNWIAGLIRISPVCGVWFNGESRCSSEFNSEVLSCIIRVKGT